MGGPDGDGHGHLRPISALPVTNGTSEVCDFEIQPSCTRADLEAKQRRDGCGPTQKQGDSAQRSADTIDLGSVGEDWSWQHDGCTAYVAYEGDGARVDPGGRCTETLLHVPCVSSVKSLQQGYSSDVFQDRAPQDRNQEDEPDLRGIPGQTAAAADLEECLGSPVYARNESVGVTDAEESDGDRDTREETWTGVREHGNEAQPFLEENTILHGIAVDKQKRKLWRKMPQKVQNSVQTPPPGPFSRADLRWETKINVGCGKRRETQKATIPWNRLDDFLEGEMSGRQHPCTFVEESRKARTKQEHRKQVRAESALQEIR